MADFNITDPEIIKMLKGLAEEGRQGVADQIQESLDSGEVRQVTEEKETKIRNRTKTDLCWERSIERLAPTEYKGKPMGFGGIINISESIMPDGEGIYYLIATGSAYVYADDEGKIQDHFIKWNEDNPDVRDREDCWSSDYYGEKK